MERVCGLQCTIATETKNQPRKITDLLESLRQPKKGASKLALERMSMNMRVVRISSIRVVDPVQVSLLGTNRYYQLDVMADVGDRSYEIKTDKDPVVYYKEYPVTCVSISIPSWLQESDRAQGAASQAGLGFGDKFGNEQKGERHSKNGHFSPNVSSENSLRRDTFAGGYLLSSIARPQKD